MAVTTKKQFPATTNATTTVFSPVSIQLNNQDDLDVYVTLSGGTRVLQLRQSTGSTAQSSHPQVNNTDGLYFPAVSAGTTLYNYTLSSDNNTITFNSALPQGAVVFCERRTRDADSAYTSFASGSTIRATDLNNSSTESNFTAQDARNKALDLEGSIFGGVQPTIDGVAQPFVTSSKIIDGSIVDADINASAAIAQSKIATGTLPSGIQINSNNIVDGSIVDANINSSAAISHSKLNLNIVNSDINASADIAGSKLADDSVTLAKLGGGALPTDITVASANIVDGTIVNADINASADISGSKLANDSVTLAKLGSGALPTDITVDSVNLQPNAVTTDKIADGELTTLAGMQSGTASVLADSTALTASTAELNQLDGITLETSVTTNSDTRIPTSKAVNDLVLSVTNALGGFVAIANETSFPTANPDPSNNAGTVVSISQLASGLAVNSSGVATITNGAGTGNTVTITGFPNSLHSQTLPASSGLQVQTTSTLHTYTFHKQLASAADIQAISATVNSFSNRYRVSASAPTSSLDGGDLWYDTTNSKLMVYSSQNSAWEESSAIGNFFISTISSSSNTGGGSATANGTAYRFTISNAPVSAQQLIVSVDGVIQKPNAGSSQPSEGFVLVGNDIIFGSAPANGASMFVTVIGSTVGIGTPSDNTVTTAILQNGSVTTAKIVDSNVTTDKIANNSITEAKLAANSVVTNRIVNQSITNAKVNDSAAIAGTKISPDFGSQNITTTGQLFSSYATLTAVNPTLTFSDSDNNPDYTVNVNSGVFKITDSTNSADRFVVNSDGHVDVTGNLDVGAGLDVTGRIFADTMSLGGTGTGSGALLQFSNNTAYSATGTNAEVAIGNANSSAATNSTGIHMFTDGNGRGVVNLNACNNSTNASADFVVQTRHSGTLGERLRIKSEGTVDIAGNLDVGAGIDVTGNITVSGTVDGVDIAARNTLFGGLTSSSGVLTNGVTATTQSASDNSTKVATTAYTDTAIATKMPLAGGEFTGNITTHDVIPDSNAFRNIGTSSVKFNQVHATTFHGDGSALTGIQGIPSGVIMLWSGASNAIPSGFVLCDGNNSTPDLRDRFVVGAGNTYSVGDTGGATTDSISLSVSGSTSSSISQAYSARTNYNQQAGHMIIALNPHSHSFSGSGSATVDTLPPYYALCYIMKT